jgi:hypothetical protein
MGRKEDKSHSRRLGTPGSVLALRRLMFQRREATEDILEFNNSLMFHKVGMLALRTE